MSQRRKDEQGIERMRELYAPARLTPAKRQTLYTAIDQKASRMRETAPRWQLALAGAATAAAALFFLFGNVSDDVSLQPEADLVLTDELFLWSDLIGDSSSEPLPEQYDAVAVVFLGI